MTSDDNSLYFIQNFSDIITSESSPKYKFQRVFSLIKQLAGKITDEEERFFPSFYAKIIFINKKLNLSEEIKSRLGYIRKFAGLLRRNPYLLCVSDDLNFVSSTYIHLFEKHFKTDFPSELRDKINFESKLISYRKYYESADNEWFSDVFLVKEFIKNDTAGTKKYEDVKLISDDSSEYFLRLSGRWLEHYNFLWIGAKIYIKNAAFEPENKLLKCRRETFITLEPEHFLDVSEIAECFNVSGSNPNLFFLNRNFESDNYYNLLFGNIINRLFDELIVSDDTDFGTEFELSLKARPLHSIAAAKESPASIKSIKHKAALQFEYLRKIVPDFKKFHTSVEPAFVSDEFGIRGRLDLFLEDKEDPLKKTIIELKSGKAPSKNLYYMDDNQNKIITGIWHNHFIQVTCYNMLIDSVFENRTGDSCILYSSTDIFPLRDAPNITLKKQEALILRNKIIALSNALRSGNQKIFETFTLKDFGNRPSYIDKKIIEFSKFYHACSKTESDYFHFFNTFIEKEIYDSSQGDDSKPDRIVKIQEDLQEKVASAGSFTGLVLNIDKCDLKNFHLTFDIPEDQCDVKTIRVGDISVLYPQFDSDTAFAGKNQLFKCVIKDISSNEIIISLRNKTVNPELFIGNKLWIIEEDSSENLLKKMFASTFTFLTAEKRKRDLILGLIPPTQHESIKIDKLDLTEQQSEIISKALAAKDYFLIQGPPGTGKTSFVLKNIAEYIYQNSDENVLFLTYTNRAADEICKALKSIDPIPEMIRVGNKESSEHEDILLSKLTDDMSMNQVYKFTESTRFYICTVAFALLNPELFKVKQFKTAIIDEASQILEPQINGILTKVEKFIMIGDEKQLPAVVTQAATMNKYLTNELTQIGMDGSNISLFERLLHLSINNNYSNYAMLTQQARMHDDIQVIANKYFYDNALESMNFGWQNNSDFIFDKNSINPLEKMLASDRAVFFSSIYEPNRKHNTGEADLVCKIISLCIDRFAETDRRYTIGVISPFRAQCSLIRNKLQNMGINDINVDTVERYQGSERDIIIISTGLNYQLMLKSIESVANINGKIIDRKLNVAVTRAKQQLIITGNASVLQFSESYNNLINYFKSKGAFFDIREIE